MFRFAMDISGSQMAGLPDQAYDLVALRTASPEPKFGFRAANDLLSPPACRRREGIVDIKQPHIAERDNGHWAGRHAKCHGKTLFTLPQGVFRLLARMQVRKGEQHTSLVTYLERLPGHDNGLAGATGDPEAS